MIWARVCHVYSAHVGINRDEISNYMATSVCTHRAVHHDCGAKLSACRSTIPLDDNVACKKTNFGSHVKNLATECLKITKMTEAQGRTNYSQELSFCMKIHFHEYMLVTDGSSPFTSLRREVKTRRHKNGRAAQILEL